MCPVDSKASCADPKALSCSFRGCGPLPQVPTTKATSLSYLGTHERSLAGGRTSLLCRAATELKLAVTLASLLDPDNIIVLDQEHVDDGKKEEDTPDWCPTQNCFATGNAAFKVENNREEMTNCFIGGYRNNKYISNMFAAKPRCAKADSIVHDEARGFVWGDSSSHPPDCPGDPPACQALPRSPTGGPRTIISTPMHSALFLVFSVQWPSSFITGEHQVFLNVHWVFTFYKTLGI